ncbi:hypothetical protein D1872_309190 [compost metagenome]
MFILRQQDRDPRPFLQFAVYFHPAPMSFHRLFDDGQAQARTAFFAPVFLAFPVERFKY